MALQNQVQMSKSIVSKILESQFTLLRKLGEGTFASVFQALNNENNEHYAVKQIYVQRPYLPDVMEEASRLISINSDNVIKIIDYSYDSEEFYLNIIMELCRGSLRGQIQDRTVFDQDRLLTFIIQMTAAFLELQRRKLMHLDLKPENILYADQAGSYYKICDFGCSQISNISRLSGYEKSVFGTFNYLAPEVFLNFQGQKTRSSADMWSLGIILYEMVFWRYPFPAQNDKLCIDRGLAENYFLGKGFQISYEAMGGAPHEIIKLIRLMLAPLPTDRLTWAQLKERLKRDFSVQEHEFMNIVDVTHHFMPVTELYLNLVGGIGRQVSGSAHLFWKTNAKFALELRQTLIYYCYIVCQKFNNIFELKQKLVDVGHQKKVNQLLQRLVNERDNCRDRVKQFEVKDFNYREALLRDQLKVCVEKVAAFKGSMDIFLQLLQTFCLELLEVIQKDLSLFADQKNFQRSFKIDCPK